MRTVLLAVAALLALPSLALAAPPNDDFANATDLSAIDPELGGLTGVTTDATKEAGEPAHAGNAGGRSLWYTWTAPGDGSVPHLAIVTDGFDTLLGVYTGAAVGALAEVASNDDERPFGGGSSVSFATTPGEVYRIAVDGFGGKSGLFFLEWRPSPLNDNFADAAVLPGAAGTRTGDTIEGATLEPGELDLTGFSGSAWYLWTPPPDGTYKLSTVGSTFDTAVAVYEGADLAELELIALNDDDPDRGCCSSWIPLAGATATTTYAIQVVQLGPPGRIAMSWGPLVLGTRHADVLVGTPGAEEIRGRGGNDLVRGGGGDDILFGGGGNDRLLGGPGRDFILDRTGNDVLNGGRGGDRLIARDGRRGDLLVGGPGGDVCRFDRGDVRRTC